MRKLVHAFVALTVAGLVATLGAAARRHAEQLTWESAADQVERHLADLVAGRVPPPSFVA